MHAVTMTNGRTTLSVDVAETRAERVRGLLGRNGLEPGEGFLLQRTRSVHTFGMRFPIAVALLDRSHTVLAVKRLPPGRLLLPRPPTRHVLECRVDVDLRPGDRLELRAPDGAR